MSLTDSIAHRCLPPILRWLYFVPIWVLPMHAGVIVDISQSGSQVISSYSGTINTNGLSSPGTGNPFVGTSPQIGFEIFGPLPELNLGDDWLYQGIAGPSNFGIGGFTLASASTGDVFGIVGSSGYLFLPVNYVSGTHISGTDTWSASTILSLGLSPGTYTYTWGRGADGDSLVLNIGTTTVPEPSSLGLIAVGVLALVVRWRSRRQTTSQTAI